MTADNQRDSELRSRLHRLSEVDVGTTFRVKIPAEVIGPDIGEVLDSLTADS